MKFIAPLAGVLIALILIVWLGLRVKPAPFPAIGPQPAVLETIPLPEGLPAPVERFYRQTYGEAVPMITSTVLSGRGSMAPFGLAIPMRFRFFYDRGRDYRAKIDMTFFGLPFMKADETYIDGHAVGKLPTGIDEGAWFDDAMNVRVWCEVLTWFPAALLTDGRVRWEPVDETTALLAVPFGDKQQRIVVRFDPETGKVQYFEAMKFRKAGEKVLWINAVWQDQGKPWIHLNIEEQVFNVAVREAIRGE